MPTPVLIRKTIGAWSSLDRGRTIVALARRDFTDLVWITAGIVPGSASHANRRRLLLGDFRGKSTSHRSPEPIGVLFLGMPHCGWSRRVRHSFLCTFQCSVWHSRLQYLRGSAGDQSVRKSNPNRQTLQPRQASEIFGLHRCEYYKKRCVSNQDYQARPNRGRGRRGRQQRTT